MKKIIMPSLIALTVLISSCGNSSSEKNTGKFHAVDTTTLTKGDVYYVCPMHPEQTSDSTGSCPVCGDELVKVEKK